MIKKYNGTMKRLLFSATSSLIILASGCSRPPIEATVATEYTTFCNPINIGYRFMKIKGGNGIREAADPVVIRFKNK